MAKRRKRNIFHNKKYTAQDYLRLKKLWKRWNCDFTLENIKRLQKYFPERSTYSLAIHLFEVIPHDSKLNWSKFRIEYDKSIKLRQKERRGKELTEKQKELLLGKYQYKCPICGQDLHPWIKVKINFHHKIPLNLGGKNTLDNIQPLCYRCHKRIHKYGVKFKDGEMFIQTGKKKYTRLNLS